MRRLIARAQEAGELRPDVVYEDISVLLWTTGRVVDATRDVAPEFWQRYLALVVDGLRAHGASALPQPPLSGRQAPPGGRSFRPPAPQLGAALGTHSEALLGVPGAAE